MLKSKKTKREQTRKQCIKIGKQHRPEDEAPDSLLELLEPLQLLFLSAASLSIRIGVELDIGGGSFPPISTSSSARSWSD